MPPTAGAPVVSITTVVGWLGNRLRSQSAAATNATAAVERVVAQTVLTFVSNAAACSEPMRARCAVESRGGDQSCGCPQRPASDYGYFEIPGPGYLL